MWTDTIRRALVLLPTATNVCTLTRIGISIFEVLRTSISHFILLQRYYNPVDTIKWLKSGIHFCWVLQDSTFHQWLLPIHADNIWIITHICVGTIRRALMLLPTATGVCTHTWIGISTFDFSETLFTYANKLTMVNLCRHNQACSYVVAYGNWGLHAHVNRNLDFWPFQKPI